MTRKIEEIIRSLYYDKNVYRFANEVLTQMIYQVNQCTTKKDPLKILVAYHADLDGCASAFAIHKMLEAALTSLSVKNLEVSYKRINYNYNLEKTMGEQVRNSDMIFVVDYSFSSVDHMKFFINNVWEETDIVWIDHHATSIDMVETGSMESSKKEVVDKFMNMNNLYKFLYTEKGCSGALLSTILGKIIVDCAFDTVAYGHCSLPMGITDYHNKKIESLISGVPEIIKKVSLYDTFHPDASREFYYAINTVEYDPQTWLEESKNVFSDVWELLLDINGLSLKDYWNDLEIDMDPSLNINKLMEKGKTIYEFDHQSNMILQRGTMFDVIIKFKGKEYNAAVINSKGNSYKFEDTYYNRDCVIIFYFNSYGTYTYSIFVDENNDKTDRINAKEIAELLSGGGHTGAAGFTFYNNIFEKVLRGEDFSFKDVRKDVLLEIKKA